MASLSGSVVLCRVVVARAIFLCKSLRPIISRKKFIPRIMTGKNNAFGTKFWLHSVQIFVLRQFILTD